MWRWSRVQRHKLDIFFFLIHPQGCTFLFLIRLSLGKWRWSRVQRHLPVPEGFRIDKICPKTYKIEKVHENGRRESPEALDHCILHRISVRIQPCGRFFASSRMGKVDVLCFPADFLINSSPRPFFFINSVFFLNNTRGYISYRPGPRSTMPIANQACN